MRILSHPLSLCLSAVDFQLTELTAFPGNSDPPFLQFPPSVIYSLVFGSVASMNNAAIKL